MRYLLDGLCEMAVVQAEHDLNQFKSVIKWCNRHYVWISIAAIGIPLLLLVTMELSCWWMMANQNARLAELAMRFR